MALNGENYDILILELIKFITENISLPVVTLTRLLSVLVPRSPFAFSFTVLVVAFFFLLSVVEPSRRSAY